MKSYCCLLLFLLNFSLRIESANDSMILTYHQFIEQVKAFHPVISQSKLIAANGQISLLKAKSFVDPILASSYETKMFKDIDYYQYKELGMKWNTNSPVSFSTGIANNQGENINPEFSRGTFTYLGVEIPLLKGLRIDQRRAALAQARTLVDQSLIEQKTIINDLILDATQAYIEWYTSYQLLELINSYKKNVSQRLFLLRNALVQGDKAVSDTVELYTQWQQFELQRVTAELKYTQATFVLSSFLWDEKQTPYVLSDSYQPDTGFSLDPPDKLNAFDQHIHILNYDNKLKILDVDKKLKQEYMLPGLTLQGKAYGFQNKLPLVSAQYPIDQNYSIALNFKTPIFFKEAKADLLSVRNKIEQVTLDRIQKLRDLRLKSSSLEAEKNMLSDQINTLTQIKQNLELLLKFELLRFEQGETSLFLVNSREYKLYENEEKKIQLTGKYFSVLSKLKWLYLEFI